MNADRWGQIKAIFDRAVELEGPERRAWLEQACGVDVALRREVESLLIADSSAGSLLEHSPMAVERTETLAVRRIGNYTILRELARGGMGVVYLGRHVSLPRNVVVKAIGADGLAGSATREVRARFRREAHIQCQLDHPHIVRVYEFFEEEDGCYLVMEYVRGSNLRTMLQDRGALPSGEAAAYAAAALEALHHAHTFSYTAGDGSSGTGIVHRDVKPANLLVDLSGNLKLTDFGIARPQQDSGLTGPGSGPGTPEYMAPEQILGQEVDARADVYAMGITLYQLLSGRVPFPRGSSSSDFDVLRAHVEREPPPLEGVPPPLAEIVARAIRKDPAERWQSAAEFRAAILAQPPAPARGRSALLHSRRTVALSLSGLLAAGIVAFGGVLWRSHRHQATLAVLPFTQIGPRGDGEYFADGLTEEITNDLARIPGLRVTGRTSASQFKGKASDLRQIGRVLKVDAVLEGSVRVEGGNLRIALQLVKTGDGFQLWSETYDRGITGILAVQEEVARQVAGALEVSLLRRSRTTPATSSQAYTAYLQGRYFLTRDRDKAIQYFREALRLDPKYPRAWEGLGEAQYNQAGAAKIPIEEGYRQARESVERALSLDPDLADGYIMRGLIQWQHDGDWYGADKSYRRARQLAPGDPSLMRASATLLRTLGRLDEAIALFRDAVELDPILPGARRNFGLTLYYAGRFEEARASIHKALELDPTLAYCHNLLAQVLLARSSPAEALREARLEGDPIFGLMALALVYHALGDKAEADANLANLVARFQADAPYQIAEIYAFRGEIDQAFAWLDRAYTTHDGGLVEIKCDPLVATLRSDARYRALLTRLRL